VGRLLGAKSICWRLARVVGLGTEAEEGEVGTEVEGVRCVSVLTGLQRGAERVV